LKALAFLRKVWTDSVWSKVIAAAITAALAAAGAGYWAALRARLVTIGTEIGARVVVPMWLLAAAALCLIALLVAWVAAVRARYRPGIEDVQANAVLVHDAPPLAVLEVPFDGLTDQQQAYLRRLFERGSRRFELPMEIRNERWFELLERYGYVVAIDVPVVRLRAVPLEVTEAGWLELERAVPA
jgi:hypothetical protein